MITDEYQRQSKQVIHTISFVDMWHCNENPIYVLPEKELYGLIIHVSVSDLYISRIGPHIFRQQKRQTEPGNIAHRHMNVEIRTEAPRNSVSSFLQCVFAVRNRAQML